MRTSDRSSYTVAPSAGGQVLALRVWCLAAAIATVVFTAYVSLVPFSIDPRVTLNDALHALARPAAWRLGSRSNFVGNIVLYLPVGFFCAGALFTARAGLLRRLLFTPVVLTCSLASSVAIESAQAFVPSRVPSMSDCMAQLAGAVVGLIAWSLVESEVYGWWTRRRTDAAGRVGHLWLVAYFAVYAIAALLPLDVTLDAGTLARKWRAGGVILNPLRSPSWSVDMLPGVIGDFVLAVPIGLLASIAGVRPGTRRSAFVAVAISAAGLAAIEASQLLVVSRTSDAADFLMALAGALVGLGLAAALLSRRADGARLGFNWSAAGLVGALVVYAAYNWAPFNPVFSPALIRDRLAAFWQPPFYAYYLHSELKAVGDTLIKIAISAPLGLFWTLWAAGRAAAFHRTRAAIGLVTVSLFAVVVEVGQVLLPSRYPDNTDVIMAIAGFVVGSAVARGLVRRATSRQSDGWAGAFDGAGK